MAATRFDDRSLLCAVTRAGTGSPLYIVPSVGMTALSLINLARSIDPPRPIYSFEFAGMEDKRQPHDSIEDMASAYVAEIRRHQPTGPYYVGGHCFGGIVAHDIVTKLEALDARVAVLVLLDAIGPMTADDDSPAEGGSDHRPMPPAEFTAHVAKLVDAVGQQVRKQYEHIPPVVVQRLEDIIRTHIAAGRRYRGKATRAKIVVLRTLTHDARIFRGWRAIAGGGYSEVEVPGDTFSMLRPPHARVLGKHLSDILAAEK